jgi:hypothetical protein
MSQQRTPENTGRFQMIDQAWNSGDAVEAVKAAGYRWYETMTWRNNVFTEVAQYNHARCVYLIKFGNINICLRSREEITLSREDPAACKWVSLEPMLHDVIIIDNHDRFGTTEFVVGHYNLTPEIALRLIEKGVMEWIQDEPRSRELGSAQMLRERALHVLKTSWRDVWKPGKALREHYDGPVYDSSELTQEVKSHLDHRFKYEWDEMVLDSRRPFDCILLVLTHFSRIPRPKLNPLFRKIRSRPRSKHCDPTWGE